MAKTKAKANPKAKEPAAAMKEYRLLAGQHIGPDHSVEPAVVKAADGTETRRWPSRTYGAGDVVASEKDLVARFGDQKFSYLGDPDPDTTYFGTGSPQPGDPTPLNVAAGTHAPHGQTGTGYPQAVQTTGPVKQGSASEATLETLKEKQEELAAEEEEARAAAAKEAEEAAEEDEPSRTTGRGRRSR